MIVTFNTKSTLISLLRNRQMTFPTTSSFRFFWGQMAGGCSERTSGLKWWLAFWVMCRWDIWKSGFSLRDTRRICIFHTHGWALPFLKAESLFIGNREAGTAVRMVFHVPLKALIWTGWQLLFAIVTVKPDRYVFVYQRSPVASPSVLEVERSRQVTTDWFCCELYLCLRIHPTVFPPEEAISPPVRSQCLLLFVPVQQRHGSLSFWNWVQVRRPCFGWPTRGPWTALDWDGAASVWSPCVLVC